MARKGRPRKTGTRTKSGRLKAVATFDKGTDQAQLRRELFAGNGYDAIGRAYAVGLLGDGEQAKDRLVMARRYAQAYHAEYSVGRYRCPLNNTVRGLSHVEGNNDRREWVDEQTARVNALGCGPFFDQLVDPLGMHTDHSPAWLERLIEAELANRARVLSKRVLLVHDPRDWIVLVAALKGLDALLPQQERRQAILVARAA